MGPVPARTPMETIEDYGLTPSAGLYLKYSLNFFGLLQVFLHPKSREQKQSEQKIL
jgi:hypothetical protein